MATIESYETKAGKRWRVRYRTPDRRSTDKRGFTTKRDAQLFANKVESRKAEGTYVDPTAGRVTVGQLAEEWFARQSHWKPSTRRGNEISWRIHVAPQWERTQIADVRPSAISAWIAELSARRSPTIVLRAHGVLAGVLDDAVRDRLISWNPARGLNNLPRKRGRSKEYLTHDQVDALAEGAGDWSTLVYLACYTGLRWGEIAALRVRHVNMLKRRISVEENAVEVGSVIEVGTPKSAVVRTVQVPKFIVPMLAHQCEGKGRDDLVFEAPRVKGYIRHPKTGKGWFHNAKVAAGIEGQFTIHGMRHTAASLAVQAGANAKVLQRMMGHASAAMTLDVYADLFESDLNEVADALDAARLRRPSEECGQSVGTAGS